MKIYTAKNWICSPGILQIMFYVGITSVCRAAAGWLSGAKRGLAFPLGMELPAPYRNNGFMTHTRDRRGDIGMLK